MKIDRAGFMRYNRGALKAAPKERISYMIGIIGAMEIEVAGITAALTDHKTETLCGVTFHTGKLNGTDVVAAKCGVGKVNAAMCTAAMILSYAPSVVINTGVAGGIGEGVKIGNMVVASHTVQYDYDTTAIGEPIGTHAEETRQEESMMDEELREEAVPQDEVPHAEKKPRPVRKLANFLKAKLGQGESKSEAKPAEPAPKPEPAPEAPEEAKSDESKEDPLAGTEASSDALPPQAPTGKNAP